MQAEARLYVKGKDCGVISADRAADRLRETLGLQADFVCSLLQLLRGRGHSTQNTAISGLAALSVARRGNAPGILSKRRG